MLIIREVFRCKPGKAGALIDKFKAMNALSEGRGQKSSRILVDAVSTYWTVITEFDKWMLRDWWRHLKNRYGY